MVIDVEQKPCAYGKGSGEGESGAEGRNGYGIEGQGGTVIRRGEDGIVGQVGKIVGM